MSTNEERHALYEALYTIRYTEELIQQHYKEDEMKTPMHMSMGEEAIVVGMCQALRPDDQVLGTYRSHALYLAKTGDLTGFWGEMLGRSSGIVKGVGGSMHLINKPKGFLTASAIVASHIPVAVGAAYANVYAQNDRVVAVFFGDGAIDEGVFFESVNNACLMKLPVIFVCEDNGYAVHNPAQARHGYRDISDIMSGFDLDVYASQSTDAAELFHLSTRIVENVRRERRPAFCHFQYYRYLEHVGVNDDFSQGYRPQSEAQPWLEKDPVSVMRAELVQHGAQASVELQETRIRATVDAAYQHALASPFADASVVLETVVQV